MINREILLKLVDADKVLVLNHRENPDHHPRAKDDLGKGEPGFVGYGIIAEFHSSAGEPLSGTFTSTVTFTRNRFMISFVALSRLIHFRGNGRFGGWLRLRCRSRAV